MIFNPLTLKYLYNFKTSSELFPSIDLLTLILDNSVFVDIFMVEHILFSYKSKQSKLLDFIKTNFRKYKAGDKWILMSINFSADIFDAVWKNRKTEPMSIGIANNIIDEIPECNKNELENIYEKLENFEKNSIINVMCEKKKGKDKDRFNKERFDEDRFDEDRFNKDRFDEDRFDKDRFIYMYKERSDHVDKFIYVDKERFDEDRFENSNKFIINIDKISNLINKIKNQVETFKETDLLNRILRFTKNTQNIKIEDFINFILNRLYRNISGNPNEIRFDHMITGNINESNGISNEISNEIKGNIQKKRKKNKNKIGFNSEPDLPVDLLKLNNNYEQDLPVDSLKVNKQTRKEKNKNKNIDETIKKPTINNTLNFKEIKIEKIISNEKYIPLDLSNAFFVYNRNNIRKDTLRKRDDLVNPMQLQFIKLHDQKRPAIYRKRGEMIIYVHSYKKIPQIISYDQDSSEEWELNNEDGISCDQITESEEYDETSSDGNSWINKDSSEIEIPRNTKKPIVIFDTVKINVYFKSMKYKNANLIKSDLISEDLLEDIKKAHNEGICHETIALEYNVSLEAIKKVFLNKV